jgi:Zn-dependent M16 (insulinase) family peptidase
MLMPDPLFSSRAEDRLGQLAMQFRAALDDDERQAIAANYKQLVEQLIQSNLWDEMPAMEDQLPDDWMPNSFHEYWLNRR